MRLSERWLREWVNPPADAEQIAERLTLAGIEAQAQPLLPRLPRGVVVGRIMATEPHPNAQRLRVCRVDVGDGTPRQIICGAGNARAALLAPTALPGAELPDGTRVDVTELRGVRSEGMLCSAAELGLAERGDGLLELDGDITPGTPIERALALGDQIIELELTPNRGDCASVLGVARELAALFDCSISAPTHRVAVTESLRGVEVQVEDPTGCPHYAGRVIEGLNPTAITPNWMRERLHRSGLRAIHPLVDVTNYVMLELGQPMHAFDLARLHGAIHVRRAQAGEQLRLLDERTVALCSEDLVIADPHQTLALAGIMGGEASAIGHDTVAVFLESACFDPTVVAAGGRRHGVLSDSRYRFERGVDPALQRRALERATQLIQAICGGAAGPVTEVGRAPTPVTVKLRQSRLRRLLGTEIPVAEVPRLLNRLGIDVQSETADSWLARVPPHRYDLRIEADLVEEVGRLYGYHRIPARAYRPALPVIAVPEGRRDLDSLRDRLAARGYREVISYSFVDPALQSALDPQMPTLAVDNPIADNMSVMRGSLWPGLIAAWRYNRQRQLARAKLFEIGTCFRRRDDGVDESLRVGGLVAGSALPEHWRDRGRAADLFDVKGDLEAAFTPLPSGWRWMSAEHPALHPGRCARIYCDQTACGWAGELHPGLAQRLDAGPGVILFELDWAALAPVPIPAAQPLPEFPSARRDIAVVVDESVPAQALVDCVRGTGLASLRQVVVFDAYHGPELGAGRKSLALGLIFQDLSRTLTDKEVEAAVSTITARLSAQLGASLRG